MLQVRERDPDVGWSRFRAHRQCGGCRLGVTMPIKRLMDLSFAALALVCLAPLMVLIACAIRISMGRPVLFRHNRIGFRGRCFTMYKFRTMFTAWDIEGKLLPDERRLTRIGRLVRSTSLDELPQLWNVVRGDMSLVGPRPLLPEYLPRYSARQARRLEVKPGITGLVQVSGRNALSWDEKFELDVWYVDHQSIALDLKILLRTAVAVVRGRGVSAAGHATMPEFLGSAHGRGARWRRATS